MSLRLIQRHYLMGFFRLFFIISFGLASVISLLDLVEKLDELMPRGAPVGEVLLFPLYNLPKYLSYIMPLAALVSSLYTLGQASRRKEIVAVMAGGGRIKGLLLPFLITGMVLSAAGFALNEFVVPEAAISAKEIRKADGKKGSVFKGGTIWMRAGDGSIIRMGVYEPEKDMAKGVSVFRFGQGGIRKRIEAESAVYGPTGWALENAVSYNIELSTFTRSGVMAFPYLEPPAFIERDVRSPEEMGIFELQNYVAKLDGAGLKNIKLEVDMHSKVSYPLINFFMLVIGASFSVRRGLGGLLAGAVGVLISILYWLGYTMSLSMGYAGIFPPAVAAWLVPVLFSAVAAYLFWTVPE